MFTGINVIPVRSFHTRSIIAAACFALLPDDQLMGGAGCQACQGVPARGWLLTLGYAPALAPDRSDDRRPPCVPHAYEIAAQTSGNTAAVIEADGLCRGCSDKPDAIGKTHGAVTVG